MVPTLYRIDGVLHDRVPSMKKRISIALLCCCLHVPHRIVCAGVLFFGVALVAADGSFLRGCYEC
jgi:hypothetical protein